MVLSFHYVLLTIEYYKIIENLSSELKDEEVEWNPRLKGLKILIQVTNSEDTKMQYCCKHIYTIQKQQHYDVLQ